MMQKFGTLLGVGVLGMGLWAAAPAQAQFAKVEDAIKYRQSAFTVMSNHMGRLAAMARGTVPFDAATAQTAARVVDNMAKLPWDGFVAGSDQGNTKIKPDALKNMGDVKMLYERLNGETAKLVSAAGSLDSLRTQVGATGAACKACHDKYRN